MLRKDLRALVAIALVCFVGCNSQSGGPSSVANKPATAAGKTAAVPPGNAAPEEVLHRFLTALQGADKETAKALLTEKASAETEKHGLDVDPQGSPSAKFQVGKAKFVTENSSAVNVESTWTDLNERGEAQAYQIVWILRLSPDGWRVAGMATELIPGEIPLVMNFEDPQELLARRDAASAQLEARLGTNHDTPLQASRPQNEAGTTASPKR